MTPLTQQLAQAIEKIIEAKVAEEVSKALARSNPAPDWLTVDEAAAFLGVKQRTIYNRVSRGDLRYNRHIGNRPVFHRGYLEQIRGGKLESEAWQWAMDRGIGVMGNNDE